MEQGSFDLDDLRLVSAIGVDGTLADAAKRLKINHASAWRRLGALERRIGARLFERGRAGYQPTPAGEAALASARAVLSELGGLERKLLGQDLRPSGTVRLTTTDTLIDLVVPILARLRADQPEIVVELVTGNEFFTLTRRDADIALRPATAAPEGLVARRVARIATAVYAARGWDDGGFASDASPWVAPDESLSHLGSARWIALHVEASRIALRASSLLTLRAAAKAGLGQAALPCFLGDAEPELIRTMEPIAEMETGLWLLTHPDLRRTARIRVVLDALAGGLATVAGRLAGALT